MSNESTLAHLSKHSAIVPETADVATVRSLGVEHVNLSAARITGAAQLPEHTEIVDRAVRWAQKNVGKVSNRKLVAMLAVERLELEFARAMLEVVSGQVSIEVDGRLAYKRRSTIDRARTIVAQLADLGVDKENVLLKIPATWEGIEAAEKLQSKDGIHCHMTLLFGLHQLAACADAGAAVVSPAVGRISDWHKKNDGCDGYPVSDDPGVKSAIAMHGYLTRHDYKTMLMPSTFRSIDQAIALAGCDRISLPAKLLELLTEQRDNALNPLLDREVASERSAAKLTLDKAQFESGLRNDALAHSKLQAGVKNLSWAVVSQEKQLADWICARQDEAAESSTLQLFGIWDYDGDGFIDREEWAGSDTVFNALDRDNNGRITLEEMAIGLGAPYKAPEE